MMWIKVTTKIGQVLHINQNKIAYVKHTPAIPTAWPDYYYLVMDDGTEFDLDADQYNSLVGA